MAIEFLAAIVAGLLIAYLIWTAPRMLQTSTRKQQFALKLVDRFFEKAQALAADDRTPARAMDMVAALSKEIDRPRLILKLLWLTLVGKVRQHSEHPPEEMRQFLRQVAEMPDTLAEAFAEAMAVAVVLSALHAGPLGEFALNILLLNNPRTRKGTATTLAAELASHKQFAAC